MLTTHTSGTLSRPLWRFPRARPSVALAVSIPMTTSVLALSLPIALLLVQATLNVPQLVRLFRSEHAGVPLSGEALSLVAGLGWLVWAGMQGDAAMAISAVLALAGFGPSTWVLLRAGRPWRLAAVLSVAVGVAAAVGYTAGGIGLLGAVLTGLAVVQYAAYVIEAVRCSDWSGFSPTSGVLRVVFGLGWGLHGWLQGTDVLVVWGLLTAVTFTFTLVLALRWRSAIPACDRTGPGNQRLELLEV